MRRLLLAAFAASALSGLGCSSNVETENGTGGVSREAACDQFSKAFCDVYAKCLPVFITAGFGDVATCYTRIGKTCPATFDAPKTSATPAKISTCAEGVKNLACEALSTSTPQACIPAPGGIEDGAGCSDDAQCRSTWCPKNDEGFCGKCTALPKAGAPCVTLPAKADGSVQKECGRGLSCVKDVCVVPLGSGAACSDATSCSLGLTCFNAKCVAAGKPGSKCDPEGKTDPNCDFLQGAICNPATKVCQELGKANAGQPCGVIGSEYKICTAASKCIVPSGAMSGTCIAAAIDGAACDLEKGPDCLGPAKCVGGVCKLPDPALCK